MQLALHTSKRVLLPVKQALPSLQPTNGGKTQQKRGKLLQQAGSNGAVSSAAASTDASAVRWTEVNGSGNLEGKQSNGQTVVLNGSNGNGNGRHANGVDSVLEDNKQWHATAFPSYLQSEKDDFCQDWDEALQDVERRQSSLQGSTRPSAVTSSNPLWQAMRKEASRDAANEPILSSFLYASILSHDSFLDCLAFVLANRLSDPTMLATEYYEIFLTVFKENDEIVQAALDDIQAVRERDPACGSYSNALLFYKGYQAIQVHRIAHHLWNLDQRISARNLQSRVSEVFSMDIHPQAKFGKGILMDHGTGIVVGQTAVVGNNVSILQNVTLGGTGKADGDRHPKISDNVLIGAAATILGNITIGKGAMVAAGSLVLKPVPPKTMVAGSPAKEVGRVTGNPALNMQHWLKTINPESDPFCEPFESMLQTKSREQPDNEPVAVTQARKAAQDKVKAAEQEQALASPSAGASTDPAGSQRAASPAQASSSNGTGSGQNGILPSAQTRSAAPGLDTKTTDKVTEGYQASSNGARPDVGSSTERSNSSGSGPTRVADTISSAAIKSTVSLQQRQSEKATQKPGVVRQSQGYTKAKKPLQAPVPEPEYYL